MAAIATVIPGPVGTTAGTTRPFGRPYVRPLPFLLGAPRLPNMEDPHRVYLNARFAFNALRERFSTTPSCHVD